MEGKILCLNRKQSMLKKMLSSVPKECLPSLLLLWQTPVLRPSPHAARHMPGCYDNW